MSRPSLSLAFADMWGHGEYMFNPHDNYFKSLFAQKYDVRISHVNPDVLIYSCFGLAHLEYDCPKIFFSGENIPRADSRIKVDPDYRECSLSLTKYPTSGRNIYLPLWVLFVNWFMEVQPRPLPSNPTYHVPIADLVSTAFDRNLPSFGLRDDILFINNNFIKDRVLLFLSLESSGLCVHSYGSLFNNSPRGPIRGSEKAKLDLMQSFKTTIAMENSYFPGYNTEKIIQPYASGCIPIYSGGLDQTIFNVKSMIFANNYATRAELVEHVSKVVSSQVLYESYLEQPLFARGVPEYLLPESLLSSIEKILGI